MATVARGDYQFSAEPQPVRPNFSKYREEDEFHPPPANIMYDRRVVRGNTYAAFVIPANTQLEMERQQATKSRRPPPPPQREDSETMKEQPSGPQEVEMGPDLEELQDPSVDGQETYDFFVDRPPIPLFIPNRAGEDKETQIEDGELFDFEVEVEPVLQVLVGKSMEQARMEVIEEDEAEQLREHQAEFQVLRRAHLLDIQRVEAQDIRRAEESERRKLQAATRRQQTKLAHQKYCCRISSKRFLTTLKRTVYDRLEDLGVFADPREVHMQDQLLEALHTTTHQQIIRKDVSDRLALEMTALGREQLLEAHKAAVAAEHDRKEQIRLEQIRTQMEREERKRRRAELRAIRKKEQELKALRDRVEELFITEGETREHMTSQPFGDIDGRCREAVVATPGGFFGELLLLLTALEQTLERELTEDVVKEILLQFLQTGLKAPVLQFDNIEEEKLAPVLEAFSVENLTMDNLFDLNEEQQATVKAFVRDPGNSVPRTGLTLMWQYASSLQIRPELFPMLIAAFMDLLLLKPEDEALLTLLRTKLKLRALNYDSTGREQAVVRIRIPLKRPILQDSELDEESHEQSQKEASELAPQEVELIEDRVKLITPCKEAMSVFVVHQAAQRFLRKELSEWVKTVKGFEAVDSAAVLAATRALGERVEEALFTLLATDLPVFDFEIN